MSKFTDKISTKIRQGAAADSDSKLGVYLSINPLLSVPTINTSEMLEVERILVTRYRCGSHNLRIETGRWSIPIIPRNERLCVCSTDVQTLQHCLFECPLVNELRIQHNYNSLEEAMSSDNIAYFLMNMERKIDVVTSHTHA